MLRCVTLIRKTVRDATYDLNLKSNGEGVLTKKKATEIARNFHLSMEVKENF